MAKTGNRPAVRTNLTPALTLCLHNIISRLGGRLLGRPAATGGGAYPEDAQLLDSIRARPCAYISVNPLRARRTMGDAGCLITIVRRRPGYGARPSALTSFSLAQRNPRVRPSANEAGNTL